MRSLSVLILAATFGIAQPAIASCEQDAIQSVSAGGEVIVTMSGEVYRVDAGDQSDAALWLPADDVLICDDDEIINPDENGEKVSVSRVR
jgi:hypothetical protein